MSSHLSIYLFLGFEKYFFGTDENDVKLVKLFSTIFVGV